MTDKNGSGIDGPPKWRVSGNEVAEQILMVTPGMKMRPPGVGIRVILDLRDARAYIKALRDAVLKMKALDCGNILHDSEEAIDEWYIAVEVLYRLAESEDALKSGGGESREDRRLAGKPHTSRSLAGEQAAGHPNRPAAQILVRDGKPYRLGELGAKKLKMASFQIDGVGWYSLTKAHPLWLVWEAWKATIFTVCDGRYSVVECGAERCLDGQYDFEENDGHVSQKDCQTCGGTGKTLK